MNEDPIRRKNILNILLIGSIGMLVPLDASILFYSLREGTTYAGVPFVVFSVLPVFFILLYVLSRRGFSTLASYLFVAAYLASDSYAAYRWGVRLQMVLIAYALIIVMATILRGSKFGFFVTGIIAAFIIPLWYVQIHEAVHMEALRPTGDDAVVFSILYLLIMIVAWLYNREIERSLRRAKSSEQALKEERDTLEVRVIERTDELRQTQFEKIQQMTRLAELGQLSSGLFHDLLNLLNAISLRTDESSDPSLATAFSTTKQIESFMQAIRRQIGNTNVKESFSLNQAVSHVIQLISYHANKQRVAIIFHSKTDKEIFHFDAPFKFQEIVINLLLNAIESYESFPRTDTRVRIIDLTLTEKDDAAILRVEDNGCGMTPVVRARIFEPFFTTKESIKGIGIGLPTIKKIIEEDMQGTIGVESEPGQGSTFTVTFPINHDEVSGTDRPGNPAREGPAIP